MGIASTNGDQERGLAVQCDKNDYCRAGGISGKSRQMIGSAPLRGFPRLAVALVYRQVGTIRLTAADLGPLPERFSQLMIHPREYFRKL
jgi:hypothetical protein